MEKEKYRKTSSGHQLAKEFAFNNVINRPPICFMTGKLIKLTLANTEILSGSLPCHCRETATFAQDPVLLVRRSQGQEKSYNCPSDPILPSSASQSSFTTWPSADGPTAPSEPIHLILVWSILTASLAKESPPNGTTKSLWSRLLAKSQNFGFLGNSNILTKKNTEVSYRSNTGGV